ncbi:MAG: hypothetical protein HY757_01135 [Nitrospirae bacterium]|nr:hypothetical protein [Nitrospirota bacterium]
MKIIAGIAGVLALHMTATAVYCAESKGSMHVSAFVAPAVKYEVLHHENIYTVTGADIGRGYVDISKALIFSVWTNSNNGYLLTFAFDNRRIKEIKILDTYNSYLISHDYQELHMPHPGMKYKTKELNLRLFLLADTKPGTYQMPLAMTISAM